MVNSWAGLCTWLTRRPRPCGSGGSTGDPAKKTCAGHQGTKESAGGAQGRRRREGAVEEIFHFHWKVKVTPTLSLLLFSWYICQCLKRARGRKYSTINVSKFLPASNCSRRLVGIRSLLNVYCCKINLYSDEPIPDISLLSLETHIISAKTSLF